MSGVGLEDVASVYEALFLRSHGNIGPRQADQLFMWEAAILLGVHHPAKEEDQDQPPREPRHQRRKSTGPPGDYHRLLIERDLHARGLGPPPEPKPITADELAAFNIAVDQV